VRQDIDKVAGARNLAPEPEVVADPITGEVIEDAVIVATAPPFF
jgi:hypothetical protein